MDALDHVLSPRSRPAGVRRWLAFCAAVPLLVALSAGNTNAVAVSPSSDGNSAVIADWNAIAVSTLSADTTKQGVESVLYTALVQAAVYNAVVGVEGRYTPYRSHDHAPRGTSAPASSTTSTSMPGMARPDVVAMISAGSSGWQMVAKPHASVSP